MNVVRYAAGVVALAVPLAALADGNELLAQCGDAVHFMDTRENRSPVNIGLCFGFVQGVRNTMMVFNAMIDPKLRVCFPENGINNGQAARIVVQYLQNNPARLHENEVLLAMLAFQNAYRCP